MSKKASAARTILIVDDDEGIRVVMREALEYEGYRVLTAENGLVGLEKIRLSPRPSLVLLDMLMPVMNGRGFLDAVAADPELARIPIVIVSATVGRENIKGAVDHIGKPVDLKSFLNLVAKYSSRSGK